MWEIVIVFLAACGLIFICLSIYAGALFGRYGHVRAVVRVEDSPADCERAMRAAALLCAVFGPGLEVEVECEQQEKN